MTDGCRLTPLAVTVLALLREGDMHPYEIIRLMRQRRQERLVTLTNGTLYHTVARLTAAGLLAEVGTDREGNRPERTTYTLTPEGRAAVAVWVRRELPQVDHPAEFRVALAEAHNLPRAEVAALVTARREALTAEHATHHDGLRNARSQGVAEQYLVELDRYAALLDAELRWTDAFLARLRDTAIAWGPPGGNALATAPTQREAPSA